MNTENIKGLKILTLNTKESEERVEIQLAKPVTELGSVTEFCYGIDGSKQNVPSMMFAGRWNDDLAHLAGSKAVCMSHYNIWMKCLAESDSPDDLFIVIEDDVSIHEEILDYLEAMETPEEFDFLHLSYWDPYCGVDHQDLLSENVAKIVNPCCTGMFSYIFSPRRLWDKMDLILPFGEEIDNHLVKLKDVLDIYVVDHKPWLSEHISEVSIRGDIDTKSWEAANERE